MSAMRPPVSEEKKPSTLHVMTALAAPTRHLSFCTRLTGKGLNSHLAHQDSGKGLFLAASKRPSGLSSIAQEHFAKNQGTSQTWLTLIPLFLISNPQLMQQLIINNPLLFDGETGGVQERFFGEKTIISLKRTDEAYAPQRTLVMRHLFTSIADLAQPMRDTILPYFQEIADAKEEVDLGNLSARIALANIGILLGFDKDNFLEEDKTELATIVHKVVVKIPNPMIAIRINIENTLKSLSPNLVPELDALAKAGESVIKRVIARNKPKVLGKIKLLTGKPELTEADLDKPEILSLMKLFLIGGFETTTKLLLFSMLMLGDPRNAAFIEKMREEIAALNKPLDELDKKDLDGLNYLRAFVFEVLRLYPPFSHMRHTVEKEFMLAQNITVSETKKECLEKVNSTTRDRSDDILLPKGSIIITSPYDAHRNKELYGEDAELFNPSRWLGRKFSLRDIMNRLDFYTFGNDARACPGRIFSEQEAMLFLAKIVSSFDIKHNLEMPLPLEVGFTLEMKPGVIAKGIFTSLSKKVKEDLSMHLPDKIIDNIILPYAGIKMHGR